MTIEENNMIGKRVKIKSQSSRFNGETGTIERVYYGVRIGSIVKSRELDPNSKASTMYNILSSHVEVIPDTIDPST